MPSPEDREHEFAALAAYDDPGSDTKEEIRR